MKKLKVVLVGINSKYTHLNLAIRYLKAYTKDLDFQCTIREFSVNDRMEKLLEEIISENPEIIGFSCYIWNKEIVKSLSELIKIVNNNIEIIYGGPEVSFNGSEFLEESRGDFLIEGEGEEVFKDFIQYKIYEKEKKPTYYNGINLDEIKGLYYKKNGEIYYGGKKKNMDINDVIFPYIYEEDLDNKIVYYEASRGCPYGCKYCLSSVDRNLRFRDIEMVKKELKILMDKKVRLVKFVDRTFNCNEKFSIEIWEFLINQNTDTRFHFEISANILTSKQVKILSKAPKGRLQFEVGVQTTNNEILHNINRSADFKNVESKVRKIKALKNISQHLDLIAGLPGEDFNSFKKSFNEVFAIEPEEIQLGFLKILKGSPMESEKEKWGMKNSPYPPYEILKTKDISYEELLTLKKVEAMVDKYYNSNKFSSILKYFNLKFQDYFEFYRELGVFFHEKGYFDRNISSADYYKVFLEFNSEKLKEDNFALREIIKYDYLMFNKKRWLPDFLERDLDKKWKKLIIDKVSSCNNLNINKSKIHIEKFSIDILLFIKDGDVARDNRYIAFSEENNCEVQDVTKIISQ
ncbi:tRNA-2-methylthio-N(6)-dimethylallyladenosine synthase [Clostridium homopropionicum DSM 5847]|uniref:tRNA-2-methylthio-N(6)-dimethylallyladenosine synthase n=1 Tax=Clostridium homopropionicum DSM 5847 TaxID=1121318 RepID=A0A0L6ZF13_9CLOT|nr:B12-binding domain-containing radical SAM protein [Clostridium homopropionicum]KOA21368.1 tRNA-2-methylthio-N(6)-dimethylallyladenosine synthase [Clostridium homopropionicum DSM 5847]SFG12143.1 anaerobic magnesium-protoporphyrin IX monomethyl ester cyclase [Clostridium homopropionicum]